MEKSIFCKNILSEYDKFTLTFQKRLFCDAKPMLLPCKTAAFGMRNNRFHNVLINMKLNDSCAYEKDLQLSSLFPTYILLLFNSYVVFYMKSPTYW